VPRKLYQAASGALWVLSQDLHEEDTEDTKIAAPKKKKKILKSSNFKTSALKKVEETKEVEEEQVKLRLPICEI